MEEQTGNNKSALTITIMVFGILFTLIGFFGSFILYSINGEIKDLRVDMKTVQQDMQTEKNKTTSQDARLQDLEALHPRADKSKQLLNNN